MIYFNKRVKLKKYLQSKMELKMNNSASKQNGFTLIEILIAMAIVGIVSAALFTSFQSQQKSYVIQEGVAAMQQNLRAGMEMMTQEIRMAGYDRQKIGGMGILDISPRDIADNIDLTITGNGAIQIAADFNDDGAPNASDIISFSIADSPTGTPDGILDLTRDVGAGRRLLGEDIQALGFAFAYDADDDGILDTSGGNVIWAVDSDGDNDLDLNLDTNNDGNIDAADETLGTGNGLITGAALAPNINISDIRAVRIWMLARTGNRDNDYLNSHTYVVGHKVITPSTDAVADNDNLRMRLLTTTVKCRNLGL